MKRHLIYFILLITISICNGQTSNELIQKGNILENQKNNLISFTKVANIIDSDTESYWAYKYADSLVNTISLDGKSYFKDLSRMYSAYTYIFYGISYTKTIYAMSRGDNYSLEELSNTIIPFNDNKEINKYNLSKKELASIYGVINFYKVSRMPKYEQMFEVYKEYSKITEDLFHQYSEYEAYKTTSLKNKKLYFKTIVNLIIDLYSINNQTTEEIIVKKYFSDLTLKGRTLDKIPDDFNEVVKLSDEKYFEYISICSKIQGEMLSLLTNEIKTLAKRNE